MVQPRRLVLPAGRKLQGVMALANRIRFLEMPQLLKKEGLLFQFILVADDVAGIGRGNTKYFEMSRHGSVPRR